MKNDDFGSGALRAQARKPGRREGGFAAWGRAARSGTEVRFAAFARRRPRGPVLRTLPHPGHERRFAAHEKPRTSCPALKTTFRPLFMPNRAAFAARASARSGRGSGFRVLSCRAEGPVRVPATGAVRRIARHGRRAAPSARARRSPAAEPGHAARPRARHRVFVAPRAARRGALRASTTIHETHAYASPTQRKPSALRCRGRFVAFLWDGSAPR